MDRPVISIVIPTLNEENRIGAILIALGSLTGEKEIIVTDGQSEDATVQRAAAAGARVVCCSRGRGAQLHAAATVSSGDVLWFLHADTVPLVNALAEITRVMRDE